jgi:DNA-binding PadR family transcriptional regulator
MSRSRRPSPQTIAVLVGLADSMPWTHGYELCRSLGLKPGTVYPILMRLSERGHVETRWEQDVPPGRPPRHLYRLTESGLAAIAQIQAEAAAAHRTTTASARVSPATKLAMVTP